MKFNSIISVGLAALASATQVPIHDNQDGHCELYSNTIRPDFMQLWNQAYSQARRDASDHTGTRGTVAEDYTITASAQNGRVRLQIVISAFNAPDGVTGAPLTGFRIALDTLNAQVQQQGGVPQHMASAIGRTANHDSPLANIISVELFSQNRWLKRTDANGFLSGVAFGTTYPQWCSESEFTDTRFY